MTEQLNEKMINAIKHLDKEFSTIRTSRANPAMLDNIFAEVYGTKTPLNQLGNISVTDSSTITIQVWDTSIIKNIASIGLLESLGLKKKYVGLIYFLYGLFISIIGA